MGIFLLQYASLIVTLLGVFRVKNDEYRLRELSHTLRTRHGEMSRNLSK
jgi:hypothetical protein